MYRSLFADPPFLPGTGTPPWPTKPPGHEETPQPAPEGGAA